MAKKAILNYASRTKIAGEIAFDDSLLKKRVAEEVFQWMMNAHNSKQSGNTAFPGTLDSIMDAGNRRFLLVEMNTGNLLPEENAKHKKRLQRLGQGYGILGTVVANSEAEYVLVENSMQVMILDARENRIYFYNEDKSRFENKRKDFTDFDDQLAQFRLLFEGFYFSKPSLERS